jgi:crotonobetainyl-CoA:carnitine CoA-transferase CaiB-like acyl-CoA transferase
MKNYDALRAVLAEVFLAGSRKEWLKALRDNDVPAAPLNTLAEVFNDPQVRHLGMKQTLEHPTEGTVSLVAGGYNMSETPLTIRTPAPSLGQHNEELLGAIKDTAPAKS